MPVADDVVAVVGRTVSRRLADLLRSEGHNFAGQTHQRTNRRTSAAVQFMCNLGFAYRLHDMLNCDTPFAGIDGNKYETEC